MLSRLARNQEDWANRKSPASTATRVPYKLFTVSLPAGARRQAGCGPARGAGLGRRSAARQPPTVWHLTTKTLQGTAWLPGWLAVWLAGWLAAAAAPWHGAAECL
jgi:hypothetical protein